MSSPPLPPDIRYLFTSLWPRRIEGYHSEGISFLKPSQQGVCEDEREPPCLILGRKGYHPIPLGLIAWLGCAVGMTHGSQKPLSLWSRIHSASPAREFEQPGIVQFGAVSCLNRTEFRPAEDDLGKKGYVTICRIS